MKIREAEDAEAKYEAEIREAEAEKAEHEARFGKWKPTEESPSIDDKKPSIFIATEFSEYDSTIFLTYSCDGQISLSGDYMNTQRMRMRRDNFPVVSLRWRQDRNRDSIVHLTGRYNPENILFGNTLLIEVEFKAFTGEKYKRTVSFPIANWKMAIREYCQ